MKTDKRYNETKKGKLKRKLGPKFLHLDEDFL